MIPGDQVLGQYTLGMLVPEMSTDEVQCWRATDIYSGPIMLKLWFFGNKGPNDALRGSWNVELRHLLRLSSSPDAESYLMVIKRSGVDLDRRCFVMALSSPGFTSLRFALTTRERTPWLKEINNPDTRLSLWKGLRNLVCGLAYLHQEQMLHRNISSHNVTIDDIEGPESMRLGGFEWTIRIGTQTSSGHPVDAFVDDHTPLFSFGTDWFSLALVLLEVFFPDAYLLHNADRDLVQLAKTIESCEYLFERERSLLLRLLDPNPRARLSRAHEIVRRVDDIVAALQRPRNLSSDMTLALAALLGHDKTLTRAIVSLDPSIDPFDIEAQRRFIEDDLKKPTLISDMRAPRRAYILDGRRLTYRIRDYSDSATPYTQQWQIAICNQVAELRYSSGPEDQIALNSPLIKVYPLAHFRQHEQMIRRQSVPWAPYLPISRARSDTDQRQRKFHDFFRMTNQLDLLFADANIYSYEVVTSHSTTSYDYVTIKEAARDRKFVGHIKRKPLTEYLEGALSDERVDDTDNRIHLGPEESIQLPSVEVDTLWQIDVDKQVPQIADREITLRRAKSGTAIPKKGFLRLSGMWPQVNLIRRRKQAIEKLKSHNYLLEALQNPYFLFVDTGDERLPRPVDPKKVDDAKRVALQLLWRTRPIFALQGPPGTGKTTLIANLIGQIFADDPIAQVLVTAQAHAAVDVVRERVNKEIYRGAEEEERPLSVRLPRSRERAEDQGQDSVKNVTRRILERAERLLGRESSANEEWKRVVHEALMGFRRDELEGLAGSFCQLVRASASITYCTTTAGDLEEIANMTHTYDWSVIEEAGKAHGFDLVLPLQTGHRWLLIGDHKQLPPYKYEEFWDTVNHLDEAIRALEELPGRAGGLVDMDLINHWKSLSPEDKTTRKKLWLDWLQTFRQVFESCRSSSPGGASPFHGVTHLSSMLNQQHRMHPAIGDLISNTYYGGTLESATVDDAGRPEAKVVHNFVAPKALADRSIIWLDTSSAMTGLFQGRVASDPHEGVFTSSKELDAIVRLLCVMRRDDKHALEQLTLAILSPYKLQVGLLRRAMRDLEKKDAIPRWVKREKNVPIVHTVDSFQGNEADIVMISLVRCNDKPNSGQALGFLKEPARMNVLLSRGERLIVLVGAWTFFARHLAKVPADINQPLGHLRMVMDQIRRQVRDGVAAVIDANTYHRGSL